MSDGADASLRLFFALWPEPDCRDALVEARDAGPAPRGRVIPAERLHLTLVFLGATAAERLGELRAIARAQEHPGFTMLLDRAGHFGGRPGCGWIGPLDPPPPLLALQESLQQSLLSAGWRLDSRDFVPHVTLRRGGAVVPPVSPIRWPVKDFVLAESRREGRRLRYRILQRFILGAGEA